LRTAKFEGMERFPSKQHRARRRLTDFLMELPGSANAGKTEKQQSG
jgi:hypothetical protein